MDEIAAAERDVQSLRDEVTALETKQAERELAVQEKRIELVKTQAKHEVWGGRRWVNVQVESLDRKLAKRGTVATYTFAPAK